MFLNGDEKHWKKELKKHLTANHLNVLSSHVQHCGLWQPASSWSTDYEMKVQQYHNRQTNKNKHKKQSNKQNNIKRQSNSYSFDFLSFKPFLKTETLYNFSTLCFVDSITL